MHKEKYFIRVFSRQKRGGHRYYGNIILSVAEAAKRLGVSEKEFMRLLKAQIEIFRAKITI